MSKKFHLSEDGATRECKADKGKCTAKSPNGEPAPHGYFDSFEEARAWGEALESSRHENLMGSLSKKRSKTSLTRELEEGQESAKISAHYQHWALENGHLHNATGVGNDAELLYYSSPQGQLELQRRIATGGARDVYKAISQKIQESSFTPATLPYDEETANRLIEEGSTHLLLDHEPLVNAIKDRSYRENNPEKERALGHMLIAQSEKWMNELTPEEQEAVSWFTSNGFSVAQHGISDDQTYNPFQGLIDEDEIFDSYSNDYERGEEALREEKARFAREYRERILGAVKKAPKLEEPVIIARGTSLSEVRDLIGGDALSIPPRELISAIESGDLTGEVREGSRMRTIPSSASVLLTRAVFFSNEEWEDDADDPTPAVILSVRTRSFPSPVNVGAWGTKEGEVLIDPTMKYRITGGNLITNNREQETFIVHVEAHE